MNPNIQRAEATDFGATAADRVQGGKNGILYIDASDNKLKLIDTDGEVITAAVNEAAEVVFTP